MPYQRLARHVLDEWRLLERRLAGLNPSSAEAEQLMAQAHALRDEYQHLIAQAELHHRPVPPPFPDATNEGVWNRMINRFSAPARSDRIQTESRQVRPSETDGANG